MRAGAQTHRAQRLTQLPRGAENAGKGPADGRKSGGISAVDVGTSGGPKKSDDVTDVAESHLNLLWGRTSAHKLGKVQEGRERARLATKKPVRNSREPLFARPKQKQKEKRNKENANRLTESRKAGRGTQDYLAGVFRGADDAGTGHAFMGSRQARNGGKGGGCSPPEGTKFWEKEEQQEAGC